MRSSPLSTIAASALSRLAPKLALGCWLLVALTVLALQHQLVPPTVNLDAPDPAIPVEVVSKEARPAGFDCAVKTSLGFGGHNAALVLTRA